MSARYKVMCGCECCISTKSIHSSLLSWRDRYLEELKDIIQNSQRKRSGEKAHHIYETYKNTLIPHEHHIYARLSYMEKTKLCTYPQSGCAFPHWKCVLRFCSKWPCINLPDQEIDNQYSEITSSIRFHIYHIIGRCNHHDRIPLKDKKIFYMCKQESSSDNSTKVYTRKELVMMETTISDIHTSFYIPAIQKLAFCLPYLRILGANHCGAMRHTAFKRHELFQDVLCRCEYAYRVFSSFAHQIQSKYYGVNRSGSIEGILLEHFSALPNAGINSTTPSRQRHAVFHFFIWQ